LKKLAALLFRTGLYNTLDKNIQNTHLQPVTALPRLLDRG